MTQAMRPATRTRRLRLAVPLATSLVLLSALAREAAAARAERTTSPAGPEGEARTASRPSTKAARKAEAPRGAAGRPRALRPLPSSLLAGGDTCATAVALSSPTSFPCDGTFYGDTAMGMAIAAPGGGPAGACWLDTAGPTADNDVWYSWTNATGGPVTFAAGTDFTANPTTADSQIVILSSCTGPELACDDDCDASPTGCVTGLFLSETRPIAVADGQTILIGFDGYDGDATFDAGGFACLPSTPTAGGSCTDAIALGSLAPSLTALAVDINGQPAPAGTSDYNLTEPTFGNVLDQAETCYSFTATQDGWVQIAASPVSNNARVLFSPDGGSSFTVAGQCWSNPDGGYDTSAQHGAVVTAGRSYCFCVDAGTVGVVDPGDTWDVEMWYWPVAAPTNRTCATSQPIDFCPQTSYTFNNLSTVGAGADPGIPPDSGCGPAFWSVCSGDGNDINFHFTWTKGMADCSCDGFRVVQSQGDLGTDARVCDAAIQVATSCPPTPASCVATVDDQIPGGTELLEVLGLTAAQDGTTYHIQLDTYMASACPDFSATIELVGCLNPCPTPMCGSCSPVVPTGAVGNNVKAAEVGSADMDLVWTGSTVTPKAYVVWQTTDKTKLRESVSELGTQTPPVGTTALETMRLTGVVGPPSGVTMYKVLPGDGCGNTVFPCDVGPCKH